MSVHREEFLEAVSRAAKSKTEAPALPGAVPVAAMEDLTAVFTAALEKLSGELILAASLDDAARRLLALTAPHDRPWFASDRALAAQLAAQLPVAWTDRAHLADCQAAVTEAEWLIADTGTAALLLDARQPRGCYLLPEVHVVVATPERLLPTLQEALLRLEELPELPTASVFVSGPSRTADIEKTIVIPAHGPKRLIVVLISPLGGAE